MVTTPLRERRRQAIRIRNMSDRKFRPVGVLRLDGRRSWRLSRVGRPGG